MNQRILALSAIFLSPFCCAEPVYKVIGPDGHIHYTDHPSPSSSSTQVMSTIRSGSSDREDVAVLTGKGDPNRDPVLASLQVYYKQIIVESATRLCTNLAAEWPLVPGAKEVSTDVIKARSNWMNRHASLVEKKNVILHDRLTSVELDKVSNDAKLENEPIRKKLEQEPSEERLKWCKSMSATLASFEFDLMSNTLLTETIISYKTNR